MTRMNPLLERNEQFARTYTPAALGPPAAQLIAVTCLDHRVDPAIVLGLRLGDAPVIRNAGGRVTPAVVAAPPGVSRLLIGWPSRRQDNKVDSVHVIV